MSLTWSKHFIVNKLIHLADRLSHGQWQIVSAQTVDTLRAEIYHLEKTLANAPTRPTRTVRNTKPVEVMTEQQKIVDMAG